MRDEEVPEHVGGHAPAGFIKRTLQRPAVFVGRPCIANVGRGERPCTGTGGGNDGAVGRGFTCPRWDVVHRRLLGGEIHEHITEQIPLCSVEIDELRHLKGAVGEVGEGGLANVVAGLAAGGLVVHDTEVVHAKALKHGEGDHQSGVAHVADVHRQCEVGHAAVGQLVPANVVILTVGHREADLHVVGGRGGHFLAVSRCTKVGARSSIGVAFGNEVHLVEADAVFNEFEVVPVHATRVRDAFSHTKSGFHVRDALGTDAANGVSLVGADPVVVTSRQALKEPVKVVANDGGV